MYEYYTEYSFKLENEEQGFSTIEALCNDYDSLYCKKQSNPHDFGVYNSMVIKYDNTVYDCDCEADDEFDCICESKGIEQARELDKKIQEKLKDIL